MVQLEGTGKVRNEHRFSCKKLNGRFHTVLLGVEVGICLKLITKEEICGSV
jgi:hypothetical protein